MQDLYENCYVGKEKEKLGGIRKILKDYLNLNNQVNEWRNLRVYGLDKENPEIRKYFNCLFGDNISYLDRTADDFLEDFPGSYGQRLFELVMCDFFRKNGFLLKERTDDEKKYGKLPDLEFIDGDQKYYVEVTTRNSSLLKEYFCSLDDFDDYFLVAKIFHQGNKLYKEKSPSTRKRHEWWYSYICQQNIWFVLTEENKKNIIKNLNLPNNLSCPTEKHLEGFNQWISENRYALRHFKECVPDKIKERLSQIDFPVNYSYSKDNVSLFQSRLSKFIKQAAKNKLEGSYFSEGVPVILAISLSLINDVKMIRNAKSIIERIACELPKIICEDPEINKDNLQNLYAIIIDTSWYNWIPQIVGASMPNGYNNCYGIIYNLNHTQRHQYTNLQQFLNNVIPYKEECVF